MNWFDKFFERRSRSVAHNTSRRSAITRVGKLVVGTAFALPVLPFDRIGQAQAAEPKGKVDKRNDDTACEYWRYCALDGFLCTCCGAVTCNRCGCNGNERERPGYRMGVHNDINWCMANGSNTYHCTVAAIVGVGDN